MQCESTSLPADATRLSVRSRRDDVEAAVTLVMDSVESGRFDSASCFAIRLALEEAMSNALHHGNKGDSARRIALSFHVTTDRVMIEVEDEGLGFDPSSVPDPTDDANIVIPSGRGLMLMRAYMTEVRYNDTGNRVMLRFDRATPDVN